MPIQTIKPFDRRCYINSYDRLFPNQDTMPKGGFGNLIALPFQGESSKNGNTVFVNKYFEAEKNQIDILTNIKRMKCDDIYTFIDKYKEDDYNEPETEEISDDEIPKKENFKDIIFTNNVECIFDNKIYIKKLKLLPNEITYLKRLASFTNPKFYELQKLRMPIFYKTTPRIISCFEEDERFLILPRGCIEKIREICEKSNVKLMMKDTRENGVETDYKFNGKLNKKQEKTMKELILHEVGVLCATTGFGKTVVGAKIISELKTNTLVIVNRNNLLEQWKERLSYFLDINKKEIGQIGASKEKPNGRLDVASFQSLFKKDNLEELVKDYGLVIIDECHHAAAYSFEKVLKAVFRNSMIIEDIKNCILEERIPIVLTERIEHLKILKESLENLDVPIVVYKGNMGKKKAKEIQDILKEADENNKPRIILATSSSIGEGFDDSRLDTLFLTMPVSWKGRIIQYVGRLHREHEDKEKVIVYDYLDNMKVLDKMYNRRLKGYKIAGYEIIE